MTVLLLTLCKAVILNISVSFHRSRKKKHVGQGVYQSAAHRWDFTCIKFQEELGCSSHLLSTMKTLSQSLWLYSRREKPIKLITYSSALLGITVCMNRENCIYNGAWPTDKYHGWSVWLNQWKLVTCCSWRAWSTKSVPNVKERKSTLRKLQRIKLKSLWAAIQKSRRERVSLLVLTVSRWDGGQRPSAPHFSSAETCWKCVCLSAPF